MDPSSGIPQQMSSQSVDQKKLKPHPEQALKCPRCDSTSTKFCYYNNYSLSQPRYFCKSCRRYWTKGGTLRNVPVGGGCRKKRSSSSSSKRAQDQTFTPNLNPLTTLSHLSYDSNDLTLALARFQNQSSGQLGYNDHDFSLLGNPTASYCDILGNAGMNTSSTNPSFLDAIRTGFLETQNHLQNLYSVHGNGDMGEVDNGYSGGRGFWGEMIIPYDQQMSNAITQSVNVTSMKQELCSGKEQSERRLLGGFTW